LVQRRIPAEEWAVRFRRQLAKAKFKALATAQRHLILGLAHPGRKGKHGNKTERWYEDPLPKDAREAQKYAELRSRAIDQILAFSQGGRKQKGAEKLQPKAPSLEELANMTDERRDETLRELVMDGTYNRNEAERILAAARAHAEQMEDFEVELGGSTPTGGTDSPAEGKED